MARSLLSIKITMCTAWSVTLVGCFPGLYTSVLVQHGFHCFASGPILVYFLVAVSRNAYSVQASSIFKVSLCVL